MEHCERPKTANTITGKSIDMQEFYASVIEDLQMIVDRVRAIEHRLDLLQITKVPERHMKLKSIRY
jgi:hypothetical protein